MKLSRFGTSISGSDFASMTSFTPMMPFRCSRQALSAPSAPALSRKSHDIAGAVIRSMPQLGVPLTCAAVVGRDKAGGVTHLPG